MSLFGMLGYGAVTAMAFIQGSKPRGEVDPSSPLRWAVTAGTTVLASTSSYLM